LIGVSYGWLYGLGSDRALQAHYPAPKTPTSSHDKHQSTDQPKKKKNTNRVQNKLTEEDVRKRAEELSFPSSVVEYFQVWFLRCLFSSAINQYTQLDGGCL
jgi:hypothetical protein